MTTIRHETLEVRVSVLTHGNGQFRAGICGLVGAARTILTEQLCRALTACCPLPKITNDIHMRKDARFKLGAVADLRRDFPDLDLILIDSGGDNLTANFSPGLVDLSIYVIDTAAGQDIPRKTSPGVTQSDFPVVNKTDLGLYVGVDVARLNAGVQSSCTTRPYVMAQLANGIVIAVVVAFSTHEGGLTLCYCACPRSAKPSKTLSSAATP
jgi:urease accessory protein